MDGENQQIVAIKFCFKAGLSATETLVLNTSIDAKGLWKRGSEPIKRF
jgi:hypothetical protein